MSGLAISILNVLFLDCLCTLLDTLDAEEIFFFDAMACEGIEYVVIDFQSITVDVP